MSFRSDKCSHIQGPQQTSRSVKQRAAGSALGEIALVASNPSAFRSQRTEFQIAPYLWLCQDLELRSQRE